MKRLSKSAIREAFESLSAELADFHAQHSVVIAGGAAMVMLFDARDATKDVDVVASTPAVRDAARRVASQLGLPEDWLNDGAKGYAHGSSLGETVFTSENLTVSTLSLYQLLAMKLSAWRDDLDISDARLILSKLSQDRDEVWVLLEPYLVPGRELKAQYAFADLWETRDGD